MPLRQRQKTGFQSTLPRGERRRASCIYPTAFMLFQSTLPRGERRRIKLWTLNSKFDFNPRSREGSDDRTGRWLNAYTISIHAPARGATILPMITGIFQKEFQSTLPRGERLCEKCIRKQSRDFNPRSREGSDGEHDPSVWRNFNFNPRSREGSDFLTFFLFGVSF